jgi:WD domain, G-beta repeat
MKTIAWRGSAAWLLLSLSAGFTAFAQETKPSAAGVAVLEVNVPAGAVVSIDGTDKGMQRRFRFEGFQPGQRAAYEVRVRFPQGNEIRRTVFLQGGDRVQLPLYASNSPLPELVLQNGHQKGLGAVAFSPNGQHVLTSGGYDRTVILWDAATGVKLRAFQGHSGIISTMAFSPDGQLLPDRRERCQGNSLGSGRRHADPYLLAGH